MDALNRLEFSTDDREWIEKIKDDDLEQMCVLHLVAGLVSEFLSLPIKNSDAIHEIVLVGPVLDKKQYQALLRCFIDGFNKCGIMDEEMLKALVQLVQDAPPGCLEVDNLIKILGTIRTRLQDTARQSDSHLFHLIQALSRVLSVMADHKVKDLDRVKDHDPLAQP